MTRGKFISIEGTEGAGKSTALTFIQNYLSDKNIEVILVREPGGTEIAEEIRKVLLFPASSETMLPETELLLMFASRAQLVKQTIRPVLQTGKWILSDRFVDASYAYQGGGRGIDVNQIKALDKLIVDGLYPDLTLLLDVPADLGYARTGNRHRKDRIEEEKIEFFDRVRNAYLERAKQNPDRIKIIDASVPILEVEEQIRSTLNTFCEKINL